MKKRFKSLVALLIVLVMCVTLLPTPAYAISASDFEKKYCTVTTKVCRAKVLVSSIKMWSLPATSSQESTSSQLATLSKDTRVNVTKLVQIKSSGVCWWGITYDGKTGYVTAYDSGGTSGNLTLQDCFLEDCTTYNNHATLKTKNTTTVKTLPCAGSTDYNSHDVVTLPSGVTATSTQLLKNVPGNYWYKVSCTYNGTSYSGYMYCGDCTTTLKYDVSVASVTAPSAEMIVGNSLTLKGKVTSSVLPLSKVGCFVYSGSNTDGTAATGGWASTSAKTFEIKGSDADTKCKIGSLSAGSYTYTIKAQLVNKYSTDGKNLSSETKTVLLYSKAFKELNTYKIQFNANGGTGAPSAQTKTQTKPLTLSSTKPTRASDSAGSYTVTLNANGGSVSTTSLSAARTNNYSFLYWNTKADGSGTNYQPGGSYTTDAAATMYAQWNTTTTTAAVSLPTPTRSNYNFKGWATSSSASSGFSGSYTPSGNVTLYATWEKDLPDPPVITVQPKSTSAELGATATFSVTSTGATSYQWYYQKPGESTWNVVLDNGKNAVFNQTKVALRHDGFKFKCVVSNSAGSVTSSVATLTVSTQPPVITSQPSSVFAAIGSTATFSVAATNANSYQWYYQKPGESTWNKVLDNGKNATFNQTNVALRHDGYKFRCVAKNAAGSTTSSYATLTVTDTAPVITSQPKSVAAELGATATFSVTATGASSYQWYYMKPGESTWNIVKENGTSATFNQKVAERHEGYKFKCVVKNVVGSTTSSVATLTIAAPPKITKQPSSVTASLGSTASFTVTATGANSYQWYYMKPGESTWNQVIENGQSATFNQKVATRHNGYKFRCVVTNAYGSTTSSTATLTTG